MSPPVLPQELIDILIDHLYDETKTLEACSLVSRSWVASSHYHLFYQVQLGRSDVQEGSKFLQVLNTSISLRTSIRVLLLRGASICVAPHALVSLLDSLPNVHSLRMYGITCQLTPGTPVQWTRTQKLRRLELSGFEALRGEVINTMAFFCRVPVRELMLCDWEVLPISLHQALHQILPDDSVEGLLHDWEVESLLFVDNLPPDALEIARMTISTQHLRSLDASEQASWAMPHNLSALLTDVGQHLTHLRLDATGLYTRSTEGTYLSFPSCFS